MTQRDNRQWKNDETRTGIKGTWQKIWWESNSSTSWIHCEGHPCCHNPLSNGRASQQPKNIGIFLSTSPVFAGCLPSSSKLFLSFRMSIIGFYFTAPFLLFTLLTLCIAECNHQLL
jgi:hypothetical protein